MSRPTLPPSVEDLMCEVVEDGCTPASVPGRARRCDLPSGDEPLTRRQWLNLNAFDAVTVFYVVAMAVGMRWA